MSDVPSYPGLSYLGLINAIAVAERRSQAIFRAWRDATKDRELAAVLNVVAIRDEANAAAFTRRLYELGHEVVHSPSADFDHSLALAESDAPDDDKFRKILRYPIATSESDPLDRLFDDHSIDPQTGALLGRYIAEARDSERRLRAAFQRIEQKAAPEAEDHALAEIAERIDRLGRTLEELKQRRSR